MGDEKVEVEQVEKKGLSKEQIKVEAEMEYKQQLDIQRENIVKWKLKIEELNQGISEIESQKKSADEDHQKEVAALKEEIESLKTQNTEQTQLLQTKEGLISETRGAVKELSAALRELQRDAKEQADRIHAVHDSLFKVQGDSVLKLKYGKMSRKSTVFVSGINQLFYYDDGGNSKSEPKYIEISSVSDVDPSIDKQMTKPWFLVTGKRRVALFAADNQSTKERWVKFIREALGTTDSPNNDDRKEDQ